jgi:uncharacterized membrane protein
LSQEGIPSIREERRSQRAIVAGILIGIGMGGLVEGSVLPQIVPWHNTLLNHAGFVENMQKWIEKGAACPA